MSGRTGIMFCRGFGEKEGKANIREGIALGRRPELIGSGLVRSSWGLV
jgi:hypothetical protein